MAEPAQAGKDRGASPAGIELLRDIRDGLDLGHLGREQEKPLIGVAPSQQQPAPVGGPREIAPAVGVPGHQIMVWLVTGTPGTPVLMPTGNIEVPEYEVPPAATQPDNRQRLDTLDTRLDSSGRGHRPRRRAAGAVDAAHGARPRRGRSLVRWYELLPTTLAVRQQGDVATPRRFVFNGAISPTTVGNAATININVSSRRLRARIRARSRTTGTPLGQMTSEVTLARSAGSAQDFTCFDAQPACRWGDYAGASPDPASTTLVWGSNQFQGIPNGDTAAWRTRNFALRVTP